MGRGEQAHQLRLDHVGVLIFVDHDVAISVGKSPSRHVVGSHQFGEPEQQVVIIEESTLALVFLILPPDRDDRFLMIEELRKIASQLVGQRAILVARHADRFDDRAFFRKAPLLRSRLDLRPQQIDHVLHVAAIENREVRLEADRRSRSPQHLICERMEGAAGDLRSAIADQLLDPPQHLLRRAPRESQQQNRTGRHAALDQPRDPIDQRACLARAGPRDNQQRTLAMGHGGKLLRVEQLAIPDPEGALIKLGARRPVPEDDYFVGHCADNSSTGPWHSVGKG